ncbi:MAG: FAD-binding oxidoreductase [Patescibacteria group bacterium]|nr:FAD-binding oxidoreductase [Patescibacteria group bacterium]
MAAIRPFKVTQKNSPADDLCRLVLEPSDGQPVFPYTAGQFVMVRENNEGGTSTCPRAFSLASAPCESQNRIELGIKAQGILSTALCACHNGDTFFVQGPYGTFTLNKEVKRIVFFAAGVGMTPFRAHIRESLMTGLNQELVLFYSSRSLEDLMYHQEFVELAANHPNFKYIPVVTREAPPGWTGEDHRIDSAMLDKYVKDFSFGDFMMCGPVPFMDGIKDLLQSKGVDTDKRLRFERY